MALALPAAQLTLALPAPTPPAGSVVVYNAETWTRPRRDRDGNRVPARRTTVTRSGTLRLVRPDGVLDVLTPAGYAFVSPLAVARVTPPAVTR